MSVPALYLRRDVAAEPTVSRWYAWAHLVAPATSALHLARSQLPILDSFVRSPAVHAAAIQDPRLRGGPFLDLDPTRVHEAQALATELRRARARQIEFADAIGALDRLLALEGKGFSLEPLYARVPDPLRGLVELVYDPAGRPDYRLLERLVYRSPVYDPAAQHVHLRRLAGDAREFVLSTPRFSSEDTLELERPFAAPELDLVFSARWHPRPLGEIGDALRLSREDEARLAELLTPEPPPAREPWPGRDASSRAGPRLRYFGHACVLVEGRRTSVLIDPLIAYSGFEGSPAPDPPRYGFEDLPDRIDFVLITHGHQDHLGLEFLLPLRHRIGTVVVPRSGGGALEDPSLKLVLEACGFARVVELDELETYPVDGGEIVGLPFLGEHGDLRVRTKMAHLVRLDGRSFVFAADSANLEPRLYDLVKDVAGDVEALFLGMECDGAPMSWLYGPLMSTPPSRAMDQSRRLCGSDCARALDIVTRLAPRQVFVYAMGQEPWCSFITSIHYHEASLPIVESDRLVESCRARGIHAERLYGRREIVCG